MTRVSIWKSISQTLRSEIAEGHYAPGDKLPTEAALSARFGVNRHTVRRALQSMSDEGLVHARRGAGVFVAHNPADYPIGRRVRFHENLTAAGRMPAKRILSTVTRKADAREAEALQLEPGAPVHVCEGLSLADDQPMALFRSVFPAERMPDLPAALERHSSITKALKDCGVTDFTRSETRLNAKTATATQALHLMINEGAPILRSIGINVDPSGRPVEYGRTWFCGDRVTLTVSDL